MEIQFIFNDIWRMRLELHWTVRTACELCIVQRVCELILIVYETKTEQQTVSLCMRLQFTEVFCV